MTSHNVLTWRPKTEPVASEPRLLWTMHKQQWQIDCALQNCGRSGWSIQALLDGQPFFRCWFRSWTDAVECAEDKYAELVRGGWTPVQLGPDEHDGWIG